MTYKSSYTHRSLDQQYPGQVEIICYCSESFWTYPSSPSKYCSRECASKAPKLSKAVKRTDPQVCRGGCKQLKSLSEYHKHKGLESLICKLCTSPPETRRARHISKYKLTMEAFKDLYNKQGGLCAIGGCRLPSWEAVQIPRTRNTPWKERDWNIDHCHKTGRVRGILCRRHNAGIAQFHDDPDSMERAAVYLEVNRG